MNCKACKNPGCAARGTDHHIDGATCYGYIPLTHADRIRAMSDEELAEWLDNVSKAWYDEGYTKETDEPLMAEYPAIAKEWLDWLKQEVSE